MVTNSRRVSTPTTFDRPSWISKRCTFLESSLNIFVLVQSFRNPLFKCWEIRECGVALQHFGQWCHSCVEDVVVCMRHEMKKSQLLMKRTVVSSQSRLSMASVVLTFSDSLSDVAPVLPILLPVHQVWEMVSICVSVFCFLSLLLNWRSVSVVLTFNSSPNTFALESPILLSIDLAWVAMDQSFVKNHCYPWGRVLWALCSPSVIHPMTLLHYPKCC